MIEALILIGGVIGVTAVGLFTSGRMTRWWSSALYALITASLAIIMVLGFYALDADSSVAYLWYTRVSAAAAIIAITSLYFLSRELIDVSKVNRETRVFRGAVIGAGTVTTIIALTPAVISDVFPMFDNGKVVTFSWGMALYILYMVSVLSLIAAQLFSEMRGAYRRRHGVLDIRFVAVRTLSYVLSLCVVAVLYSGTFYVLGQIVGNKATLEGGFVGPALIASALLGAMIFQPVKRAFNRLFDRIFYRDNYSVDAFTVAISQTLNSTNDLRTLLERSAALIAATLKAHQAFFFVNLLEGRHMSAGTGGHSHVSPSDFDSIANTRRDGVPLLVSEFDKKDKVYRMMVSHRLSLVMPLYKGDNLVGYFCLGRPAKTGYTRRDLRSLTAVSDELTIAIQNALSVDEVRKLNGTLEQRIDAATKELRASNAQLQRLDEAKDEFISMASHQLRTPLTSIKGYISMLLEGDAGKITKDQQHFLEEAFVSSERMVRLIGDFLNVSRLQTGKFVVEKHPVDLARLIEREIEGLSQNAAARGIIFVYKKPKNIPLLDLDENKMQQVVMNFSDNAIYYSKEKSKVVVSLKKDGDFVEFKVTDSGIGVPKSEQAHLFNKFFRATNARRARPDGTGVGLFLAKKVVGDHKGKIIFESKEGKGSTFGFRLPIGK